MKENQVCEVKQNRTLAPIVLKKLGAFHLHVFPHQAEKKGLYIKVVIADRI